jgi:hypothetical protein
MSIVPMSQLQHYIIAHDTVVTVCRAEVGLFFHYTHDLWMNWGGCNSFIWSSVMKLGGVSINIATLFKQLVL